MRDELYRCELLDIPYLNFRPGNHVGAGQTDAIKQIIDSLNLAREQAKGFRVLSVLETTAGQGTADGHRFEQLRAIIDGVEAPERMAVCIDTCHIFAAGYDIQTVKANEKTMKESNAIIGLERLVAIPMNDSKRD